MQTTEQQTKTEYPFNPKTQKRLTITLYRNNNIAVRRDFIVGTAEDTGKGVLVYNEKSSKGIDLVYLGLEHVDMIKRYLKEQTVVHAFAFHKEYYLNPEYDMITANKNDNFSYTLSETSEDNKDVKVFFRETWDATNYPATVRNNVNIRHLTKEFIRDFQRILVKKQGINKNKNANN